MIRLPCQKDYPTCLWFINLFLLLSAPPIKGLSGVDSPCRLRYSNLFLWRYANLKDTDCFKLRLTRTASAGYPMLRGVQGFWESILKLPRLFLFKTWWFSNSFVFCEFKNVFGTCRVFALELELYWNLRESNAKKFIIYIHNGEQICASFRTVEKTVPEADGEKWEILS